MKPLLFFLTLFAFSAHAQKIKGNVAKLDDHDLFEVLVKEMSRVNDKGQLAFQVLPFNRSLKGVIDSVADFHLPILDPGNKSEKEIGFAFSTFSIGKVIFCLYVNKANKKITAANLASGKFVIETDAAHVNFFDFPVVPSSCVKCSLKKVSTGRIDGYLYSALLAENEIMKDPASFSNLETIFYRTYDIKFGLPRGKRGKEVDAQLAGLFEKIKNNGAYDRVMVEINTFNSGWKQSRTSP